jgi:hypothetical protein
MCDVERTTKDESPCLDLGKAVFHASRNGKRVRDSVLCYTMARFGDLHVGVVLLLTKGDRRVLVAKTPSSYQNKMYEHASACSFFALKQAVCMNLVSRTLASSPDRYKHICFFSPSRFVRPYWESSPRSTNMTKLPPSH